MLFTTRRAFVCTNLLLLCLIHISVKTTAQAISSDDYFKNARSAAFDDNNYSEAIRLSKIALEQSPGYTDIQIFLGRVYFWNKQEDSAVLVLKSAVERSPAYEDATIALADVEYFSDRFSSALYYIEAAQLHHPASMELAFRKAKALTALNRFSE